MFSSRCPPTYQFTALYAYPTYAERGSGLSQAVSRQILTAGIGVFSREHQVLLVAVKMTRTGSYSSLHFTLSTIISPMFYIHLSSPELILGSLVASNQNTSLSRRHTTTRTKWRASRPAGQPPGRRTIMGAKKSPE